MEVYAVGRGTPALINSELPQTKNKSELNWFLLSLLVGPIATFIIIAFNEVKKTEPHK